MNKTVISRCTKLFNSSHSSSRSQKMRTSNSICLHLSRFLQRSDKRGWRFPQRSGVTSTVLWNDMTLQGAQFTPLSKNIKLSWLTNSAIPRHCWHSSPPATTTFSAPCALQSVKYIVMIFRKVNLDFRRRYHLPVKDRIYKFQIGSLQKSESGSSLKLKSESVSSFSSFELRDSCLVKQGSVCSLIM